MYRPASLAAGIFLAFISLAQLSRALFAVSIIAGGVEIPVWLSFIAFVLTGGLAVWLFLERGRSHEGVRAL
jgi:hypothetical protein